MRFTGPNGGSIFLPPAGCRWGGELDLAGTYGYGKYWSSSPVPDDSNYTFGIVFNSGGTDWFYNYNRGCGLSVRPVAGN